MMEFVSPAYIEAADRKPAKKSGVWLKAGAACACFCIIAFAGFKLWGGSAPTPVTDIPPAAVIPVSPGASQPGASAEDPGSVSAPVTDIPPVVVVPVSPDVSEPDPSVKLNEDVSGAPLFVGREMTAAEARANEAFGKYLPQSLPNGFAEESVMKVDDGGGGYLTGLWTCGRSEIAWTVQPFTERDEERVVSVGDTEKYDVSLYSIPYADSVPEEIRTVFNEPIFVADELNEDAVNARTRISDEPGDGGSRIHFSVKFGDVLVRINAKGADADWVYSQLRSIGE